MKNYVKIWATAPIRLYRAFISPVLGPRCRYEPTCSAYAQQAIEKHGALKGLFLAAKRVLKCHPFSGCDRHDPVPSKFDW